MKNNLNKFLRIDKYCEICQKELEKLNEIQTHRDGVYMNYDRVKKKNLRTKIIFTPDYNASGNLTHWHIQVIK